jgi:hypothetical protein
VAVPGQSLLEVLMLTARTTESAKLRELPGQVLLEPPPNPAAEFGIVVAQLHGHLLHASSPYQALAWL